MNKDEIQEIVKETAERYGLKYHRRTWRYFYTPKTEKQRKVIIRTLFVLSLPVTLPLYALYYIGQFAESSLDWLDEFGERVMELIVFKILRRWSK